MIDLDDEAITVFASGNVSITKMPSSNIEEIQDTNLHYSHRGCRR